MKFFDFMSQGWGFRLPVLSRGEGFCTQWLSRGRVFTLQVVSQGFVPGGMVLDEIDSCIRTDCSIFFEQAVIKQREMTHCIGMQFWSLL